jgi:CDP-paratose 2-epimerase
MGGGPDNSLSLLEGVEYLQTKHGCKFEIKKGPARIGDHAWWVTDTRKFEKDYPGWTRKNVWAVIDEMVEHEVARRKSSSRRTA